MLHDSGNVGATCPERIASELIPGVLLNLLVVNILPCGRVNQSSLSESQRALPFVLLYGRGGRVLRTYKYWCTWYVCIIRCEMCGEITICRENGKYAGDPTTARLSLARSVVIIYSPWQSLSRTTVAMSRAEASTTLVLILTSDDKALQELCLRLFFCMQQDLLLVSLHAYYYCFSIRETSATTQLGFREEATPGCWVRARLSRCRRIRSVRRRHDQGRLPTLEEADQWLHPYGTVSYQYPVSKSIHAWTYILLLIPA